MYGQAMGLMFQIVDDLLDVTQTADHVGKATGKDQESGKLTYPLVLGVEACRQEVDRLLTESLQAITPLGQAGDQLASLAQFMAVRTR